MGDFVQTVGVRHDLPFGDPFATAKILAERMHCNVEVTVDDMYVYDSKKNTISRQKGFKNIVLGRFRTNKYKIFKTLNIEYYQALKLIDELGMEKLSKVKFKDDLELDDFLRISERSQFYSFFDSYDHNDIMIFRENVDLDVQIEWPWFGLEAAFHEFNSSITNFRRSIYERARLFGCPMVVLFNSDDATEIIFDKIDCSADEFLSYVNTKQYQTDYDEHYAEKWGAHAKHVYFSSLYDGSLHLADDDEVEVIFDDFKDLK